MSDAHFHKVHSMMLCQGHPGAIAVFSELEKRCASSDEFRKFCTELQIRNLRGEKLHKFWKETCQEDYEKCLSHAFASK